jgi:hypothetical protein
VSAALVEELRAEVESLRELARGATATALALTAERDALRAQLAPLCAVHDALVAAAALPGAGASPEAMVAAVRNKGVAEGAALMHTVISGAVLRLATDDGLAMVMSALSAHREGRSVTLGLDLAVDDDAEVFRG